MLELHCELELSRTPDMFRPELLVLQGDEQDLHLLCVCLYSLLMCVDANYGGVSDLTLVHCSVPCSVV